MVYASRCLKALTWHQEVKFTLRIAPDCTAQVIHQSVNFNEPKQHYTLQQGQHCDEMATAGNAVERLLLVLHD